MFTRQSNTASSSADSQFLHLQLLMLMHGMDWLPWSLNSTHWDHSKEKGGREPEASGKEH